MDISINVTSSLTNSERRISKQWSITYLKQRLESITGIPPNDQQLHLFVSPMSQAVDITHANDLSDITESSRIHVNDTRSDSELKALEDESNVNYFQLNDEEYAKRSNTLLSWKQENQLGRFAPEYQTKVTQMKTLNDCKAKELMVGSRFRTVNAQGERRGVIKYIGKVPEIDTNTWCGVQFDEPVGKNNGSIKGVYYFDTQMNYGGFLKPQQIEQGDFPEESLFSDDEI